MAERQWSLQAAREMFPEVYRRTARAVEEVEGLVTERDGLAEDSAERKALDSRVQQAVARWAREMEALGLEVKGPWLVDFNSGAGYYCWKWPEEDLAWFHTYEEGFGGRLRIQ